MTARASVIITNYNYANFVAEAIQSALGQTYANCEVVVVDDGSTDSSREVIQRFGKQVIAVFKDNAGHGSAYNAGFHASKGDIALFLDADDLLDANAIQEVVRQFHYNVSTVRFRLRLVDVQGRPIGKTIPAGMPSGDLRGAVIKYGFISGPPNSGNAYARPYLERVMPLDEADWRVAPDTVTIGLAPIYGRVVSIPAALGSYRIHAAPIGGEIPRNNQRWGHTEEYEKRRDDYAKMRVLYIRHGVTGTPAMLQTPSFLRLQLGSLIENDRPAASVRAIAWRLFFSSVAWPGYGIGPRVVSAGLGIVLALAPRPVKRWVANKMLAY